MCSVSIFIAPHALCYTIYAISYLWCFFFVSNTFLMKPNKDLNFIECIRCAVLCFCVVWWAHASFAYSI